MSLGFYKNNLKLCSVYFGFLVYVRLICTVQIWKIQLFEMLQSYLWYHTFRKRKIQARRTDERSPESSGRQLISQVDSEHSVAQKDADLKGNPCAAVQRQVETHHIHQHEEDAGDEEANHIQQGAPTDQQLDERQEPWFVDKNFYRSVGCVTENIFNIKNNKLFLHWSFNTNAALEIHKNWQVTTLIWKFRNNWC